METGKMKKIAKDEVKKHEKAMHGKGFAKGGVTSASMKQYGRNVARTMNQKSSSRGR